MTVQEAQSKMTSTEFMEWLQFLDANENGFHREDYFLAQIACLIAKTNAKPGQARRFKIEDFVLKFQKGKAKPAHTTEKSKAFWLGALNLKEAE